MDEKDKKIHDLKMELRQLRLRVEDDEMHIKQLKEDLDHAKKIDNDIMIANKIALQILDHLVDDVKALKKDKEEAKK